MTNRKEYQLAIKIAGEIEKSLPASMRKTKAELRAISKDAVQSTGKFGNSVNKLSGDLNRINAVGDKVFKAIGKTAKIAGVGAAAGLGAAVKVGAEFEAQMSSVKAISGATDEEMKRLEKTALQYGSTTKFTAKESGEALEYMALAGYDADKSIEMLPNVLNLAAAGEMELGRASDQVTDAQSALGLSMEETTKMVDQMAQTSSKSNTSVEQLGDAFLQVGGTAKILKGGTAELSEVLGLLADNGIKGGEGGTKLRNIILSLAAPTDKAAAAMDQLGLNVKDSKGNFRDMSSIMQELNDKTKGMGDVEKSALLKKIFNKTDIKAVNALLGTSAKRWDELGKEIDDSAGAADRMAKTKLDNLQGDVTLMKSALEGTGVKIYKELQGPLRELVQTGTKGITAFADWFVDNFPSIKSGIEEIGSAIGAFASPFLSVGEWLLDNPAVISGALAAIGSAIITYKVVGGITSVVKAVSTISKLNPALLILGGLVSGFTALGVALATTQKEAKRANLAKHFGDISLSMEDLEDAARQIVGAGDLEKIDEIFNSMSETKNIESAMKEASRAIKKYDWKVQAGLKISKDDVKDYAEQVKSYVKSAQNLIDQKGYQVNISTKLLFGDSKTAEEYIKTDNDFFAGIDKQMESLSSQLNKKLQKAMKDGLTPQTQEAIDEILASMAEITEAISAAEAQSEWDMLKSSWSGKDLTADSFEELQKQINEKLEKEYSGIDEGTKSQLDVINAELNTNNITAEEADLRKKKVLAAGESKKSEATNKGIEFQWNTLMDTYGKDIAAGNLATDQSLRDSVYELVDKMLQAPGANTSEYGQKLRNLKYGSSYDDSWLASLSMFNPFGSAVEGSAGLSTLSGTTDSYFDSMRQSAREAQSYVQSVNQAAAAEQQAAIEKFQSAYPNLIPQSGVGAMEQRKNALFDMTQAGKQGGDKGAQAATNAIQSDLNGKTINANVTITGTYGLKGKGGSTPPGMPSYVPHAKGGIFNRPHLGMVGEAGTESVIPIKSSKDSYNLYKQTGAMLGLAGGGTTFAPVINITATGGDKQSLKQAAGMTAEEVKKAFKQMMKEERRRGF